MSYINNLNQIDLNYNQMDPNLLNPSQFNQPVVTQTPLFPQPSITQTSLYTQPSSNMYGIMPNNNMLNMPNDNLMSIANTIDPLSLNGTNLDDFNEPIQKVYKQRNKNEDNKSLIKSLAKEFVNNLKENNLSLYDNTSLNSRKGKSDDEQENDDENSECSTRSSSSRRKKKEIKEVIEDFVVNNENIPGNEEKGYTKWFFDECFNYKDFLILFVLYFVLSQEMIKDFFGKYFSSLNPDNEGKVGVQGVIIYGLILTIFFMMIRKLF